MKFLQIGDNLIINAEQVRYLHKFNDKVWVYLKGQEDALKFANKQAIAVWNFFTAATPNICPGESAAQTVKSAEPLSPGDSSALTDK